MPGSLSAACPPTVRTVALAWLSTTRNPPGRLSFPGSSKVDKAGRKVRSVWGGPTLLSSLPISSANRLIWPSSPSSFVSPVAVKERDPGGGQGHPEGGRAPAPSLGPSADYSDPLGGQCPLMLSHPQAGSSLAPGPQACGWGYREEWGLRSGSRSRHGSVCSGPVCSAWRRNMALIDRVL